MSEPKTSDRIQINIRMQNPSQDPPASSKAPNKDLEDLDVLCTFKSKNLDHGYIKDQWPYPNKMKVSNLRQEPPVSSKAPKKDLKD